MTYEQERLVEAKTILEALVNGCAKPSPYSIMKSSEAKAFQCRTCSGFGRNPDLINHRSGCVVRLALEYLTKEHENGR